MSAKGPERQLQQRNSVVSSSLVLELSELNSELEELRK